MKGLLKHPVTCLAIGAAIGYMFSAQISRVPVVNKLPQV